ncbi:MAG TPA: glycosyltransferase family 4 protein [Aquaticitalea sp.]|nr:glycosyltransferase family 4 protein [Aquaticitalea sp.]
MQSVKIKVGIFIDWYLPAFKAGGPIQSIANLVDRLKDELDLYIITSNNDLGEIMDLQQLNTWIDKDGCHIIYLDPAHQNIGFYKKLLRQNSFDVVYFNSMFSIKFTLLPLWVLRNHPVKKVLATRGMLAKGALAIKPIKKKLFLKLFKQMGFHKKVDWHATSQSEAEEIKTHFGQERTIILAPNLPSLHRLEIGEKQKKVDEIRIFFLSRIAVKKNLLAALDMLSATKPCYKIAFTIIGPVDDKHYWEKCQSRMQNMSDNIKVNYIGAIPNHELSGHIRDEHLLLLPTYGENFGHVIVESWQYGCPVIISDQTPWHNLEALKLGYDIALEDRDAFIKAIEHFAAMDGKTYRVWSNSALEHAKKFTENPEIINQTRSLFLLTTP